MSVAGRIWEDSYGSKAGPGAVRGLIDRAVYDLQGGLIQPQESEAAVVDQEATDLSRLTFAVEWIHGGRVTLMSSHRYASAMACTRALDSALSDIELPARAFRIEVPDGILTNETHGLDYRQINVAFLESGIGLLMLEGLGRPGKDGSRRLSCLPLWGPAETLLTEDDEETEVVGDLDPAEVDVRTRMIKLGIRIAVGLLLTMTHTTYWSEKRPGKRALGARSGPPMHRVFYVGRPIELDTRPAIRRWLGTSGSKGGPPTVQSLVRGHHKRQVVGVGRGGRKVIWIEPYWRGPEEAPILARPYKVG